MNNYNVRAYARRTRGWIRYPARHTIGGQWYRIPHALWVTVLYPFRDTNNLGHRFRMVNHRGVAASGIRFS